MKTDAPLVVVIDGQGGMIGRKLCDQLLETKPEMNLLALGTNSAATSAMLKGKVHQAATGENPGSGRSAAGRGDRGPGFDCRRGFDAWGNHAEDGSRDWTERGGEGSDSAEPLRHSDRRGARSARSTS